MKSIEELEKTVLDLSDNLQICNDHGDDFVVVYDRLKTANECPMCEQVNQYQDDLEQAVDNEAEMQKDYNAVNRALKETTEQLTELKKQLAKVEDKAKWRNQTIQNK